MHLPNSPAPSVKVSPSLLVWYSSPAITYTRFSRRVTRGTHWNLCASLASVHRINSQPANRILRESIFRRVVAARVHVYTRTRRLWWRVEAASRHRYGRKSSARDVRGQRAWSWGNTLFTAWSKLRCRRGIFLLDQWRVASYFWPRPLFALLLPLTFCSYVHSSSASSSIYARTNGVHSGVRFDNQFATRNWKSRWKCSATCFADSCTSAKIWLKSSSEFFLFIAFLFSLI